MLPNQIMYALVNERGLMINLYMKNYTKNYMKTVFLFDTSRLYMYYAPLAYIFFKTIYIAILTVHTWTPTSITKKRFSYNLALYIPVKSEWEIYKQEQSMKQGEV